MKRYFGKSSFDGADPHTLTPECSHVFPIVHCRVFSGTTGSPLHPHAHAHSLTHTVTVSIAQQPEVLYNCLTLEQRAIDTTPQHQAL